MFDLPDPLIVCSSLFPFMAAITGSWGQTTVSRCEGVKNSYTKKLTLLSVSQQPSALTSRQAIDRHAEHKKHTKKKHTLFLGALRASPLLPCMAPVLYTEKSGIPVY